MKTLLFVAAAFAVAPAHAESPTRPTSNDSRIRTVVYDPLQTVTVTGAFGYTLAIEFAEDEVIKKLSPGDSIAWQLVPKDNVLFLRPQEVKPETNLVVYTSRRRYVLTLLAIKPDGPSDKRLTSVLAYYYPEDEMRKLQEETVKAAAIKKAADDKAKEDITKATNDLIKTSARATSNATGSTLAPLNYKYSYSGSKIAAPIEMFDDGEVTFVKFAKHDTTPAIFLVGPDKKETLANFARCIASEFRDRCRDGEWIVIKRLGRQFTFRGDGNREVACVFNEAFPERPASTLTSRAGTDG